MTTRHMIVPAVVAALLASAPVVYGQDGKATYVMKLSTASVNDAQHEFLKRFAAAVEKDSGGRIKGEIYPASQLGSIPRQIEGTQFGSIQGWLGPPEFLVGVDERYQALSAPGLFTSWEQDIRVINDAAVRDMLFNLGLKKGLVGLGIFMIGPSAIITRKPIHHLAAVDHDRKAVARGGDNLLTQQGAAESLDQIERAALNFVSAVDREIDLAMLAE